MDIGDLSSMIGEVIDGGGCDAAATVEKTTRQRYMHLHHHAP